jgi:dolichol-phosphate mannosyltransferase
MMSLAINGITSFSIKPLRVAVIIGLVLALLALIYLFYAVYISLFTNQAVQGWTSVIVSVLFIGGLQMFMLGIIGEYLGKLFIENKKRPNYIIDYKSIDYEK